MNNLQVRLVLGSDAEMFRAPAAVLELHSSFTDFLFQAGENISQWELWRTTKMEDKFSKKGMKLVTAKLCDDPIFTSLDIARKSLKWS